MRTRLPLVLAAATAVLAVAVRGDGVPFNTGDMLSQTLLLAGTVPLLLLAFRPKGAWVVALAVTVALVPVTVRTVDNITATDHVANRTQDGAVATDAATSHLLRGQNPYTVDFRQDLAPNWDQLRGASGRVVQANPVDVHYPYLPGAFLVAVPFDIVGSGLGLGWDGRVLMLLVLFACVAVLARAPLEPATRAGCILAVGNAFVITHLAWGTNDATVAQLLILAVLLGARRPRLAGVLVALAVSFKLIVLVALAPLALLVLRRQGSAALRHWWTLPATLVATCLPFLAWAPRAFVDDTLLYNAGLTRLRYPTSGIGLPVLDPGLFHGPLLGLATIGLGAGGLLVSVLAVQRWPRPGVALLGMSIAVAGVLVPARTFQRTYLTLLVTLAACGAWLLTSPDGFGWGRARAGEGREAAGEKWADRPMKTEQPAPIGRGSTPSAPEFGVETRSHPK